MKKTKILLVDDHTIMLDGVKSHLEKEPDMLIAGMFNNGEETLRFLETYPADLVITNIKMEGIDGMELSEEILKRYPETKIILLTMMGDWKFVSKALQLGIHGYVVKEKSKLHLVKGIRTVMGGHRYYPPDLLPPDPSAPNNDPNDDNMGLTKREKEILCLLAKDPSLSTKEIAIILSLVRATVEKHLQNIKEKLNLGRIEDLVKYALENKLCE